MKNVASWLLVFFMVMFWAFRIIVTLSAQFGGDFGGFIVFDNNIEIAILFITLVCFIFIVRRVIWGGIAYLVVNSFYFGTYLIQTFFPAILSSEGADMIILQNAIICLLGIFLALFIVIDLAIQRIKTRHFTDNKTDWYFNNEKYDRKMDERADRNQYRTL